MPLMGLTTHTRLLHSLCPIQAKPNPLPHDVHMTKTNAGTMYCVQDRLPTPFGLVRSGVAPDHNDTKVWVRLHLPLHLRRCDSAIPAGSMQGERNSRRCPVCVHGFASEGGSFVLACGAPWLQNVTNQFTAIGQDPRVTFMGNVKVGSERACAVRAQCFHHCTALHRPCSRAPGDATPR